MIIGAVIGDDIGYMLRIEGRGLCHLSRAQLKKLKPQGSSQTTSLTANLSSEGDTLLIVKAL